MGGGYSRRDAQTRQSVLVLIGVHHIHPQSPLISFHFISFQFNLAGTFGLCPACFLWPCSAISAIGPCRGLPIGARHDSTMVRTMPWLVRRGVELEGNDWRQPRSSGRPAFGSRRDALTSEPLFSIRPNHRERWLGGGICLREFVLVSEHLQRATLNGKVIGPTEAVLCHRVGWRKTSPDCGGSKHDQSLAKQHHITPQLSLHAQFRHRTPFPPALFPFPLPTCLP
jgi:hypothetical protein